jgi:hypothetical protein
VARRRLTVKRIDPWSVLKFGAVVNAAMLGIGLLVVGVIFYIVDRLGLIDQVCGIALDVGFTACGLNVGNLFRAIALLGLLGLVIWTAVLVFLSFLHNLIADLTGGLSFSVIDDSPTAQGRAAPGAAATRATPTAHATGDATVIRPGSHTTGNPPVPPLGREQPASGAERERGATAERKTADQAATAREDDGELFGGR